MPMSYKCIHMYWYHQFSDRILQNTPELTWYLKKYKATVCTVPGWRLHSCSIFPCCLGPEFRSCHSVHGSKQTYLPPQCPSEQNRDRDISLSVRSYLQTWFPCHPAISAWEVDEAAGALGCSGGLMAWEWAEGSEEHSETTVASPHCRACPLAWQYGLAPFAVTLCVCSCLVVIRSSHRTTAPSHLQGGSAGHTAPFSASVTLVLASHRRGENWNSLCLLMLNLNS